MKAYVCKQETYAFVQIPIEVPPPELESNYFKFIIKQSQAYHKPCYKKELLSESALVLYLGLITPFPVV